MTNLSGLTDYPPQILCDLLSPAGEKVKAGLRETAHSTSPHLRQKASMADEHGPVQRQQDARGASAHKHPESQEVEPKLCLSGALGMFCHVFDEAPTCSCSRF